MCGRQAFHTCDAHNQLDGCSAGEAAGGCCWSVTAFMAGSCNASSQLEDAQKTKLSADTQIPCQEYLSV